MYLLLYDRKRPEEVNPLLTHNASLTLRVCALTFLRGLMSSFGLSCPPLTC